MKNTYKRVLSLLLTAAMCLSLLPAAALAEDMEPPVPTESAQVVESVVPTEPAQPVESETAEADAPAEDAEAGEDPADPADEPAFLEGAEPATLYVASGGSGDGTTQSSPLGDLITALTNVADNGTVIVLGDMTQKGAIGNTVGNKTVTLTSAESHTYTIKIKVKDSETSNAMLFSPARGGNLILKNITVDGSQHKTGIHGFGFLAGGTLTLGEGATLQNCGPRAFNVRAAGILVMEAGSKITTCTGGTNASYYGDEHDGIDNTGAAVYLCPNGTFTMTGGEISGNSASNSATGGEVSGPAAVYGEPGSTFNISGASVVTGNKNTSNSDAPANIYLNKNQTIDLSGGLSDGADINVSVSTMPSKAGDRVKIATNASEGDMQYIHSDKPTAAGLELDGTDLYLSYDKRDGVVQDAGLDSGSGKPSLTVTGAKTGSQYAIADKDGKIVSAWVDGVNGAMTLEATDLVFVSPLKVVSKKASAEAGTAAEFSAAVSYLYVAGEAGSDSNGSWDTGNNTSGNGTRAKPYATVEKAIGTIGTDGSGVVVLLNDIKKTVNLSPTSMGASVQNISVLLTSETGKHTISIADVESALNSQMHFSDGLNISMTLRNVVFDGTGHPEGNYGEFFIGNTCTLTLGEGAVLQNFTPRAVNIRAGGALVMEDGSLITGCKAGYNKAYNDVGGAYNGTDGAGAAVYVCPRGTFDMRGGEISGNTADGYTGKSDGGPGQTANEVASAAVPGSVAGVYGETNAIFKMSGNPVVNGNTSKGSPANVYLGNGQVIQLTDRLTSGADINVYVQTMPAKEGDKVQIASTTVSADAAYFHSDKATEAGVGYYGDGGAEGVYLAYDLRAGASTSVDPATGSGVIEVSPTEADTYYSILDKSGAVVSKEKVTASLKGNDGSLTDLSWTENGWALKEGGAVPRGSTIVFQPVLPGQEYTVVKTKDSTSAPADGKEKGTPVTVPVVGGNVSTTAPKDGNVTIVIDPSDENVKYAIADESGNIIKGEDGEPIWKQGTGGKAEITFPGNAGTKYQVVAVPATTETPGDSGFSGDTVTTPGTDLKGVDGGSISRDNDATEGKDKIVLKPTETTQEYAVVDKATGEVVGDWKTGTGDSELTFDNLDPNKDYQVVTRTPAKDGKDASLPTKGVDVPAATVKPGEVALGADSNGKGKITIANSDPDTKYAVVDKDGNVVAPISTGTGKDNDGWVSGTGGTLDLDLSGLPVGGEYTVVTAPKKTGDTDPAEGGNAEGSLYPTKVENAVGPTNIIPAVTEDQLSGSIQKGEPNKATVTVSPADKDMEYGLVTKDEKGEFVAVTPAGDWRKPNADGKVDFTGLDPEQEYIVVAKPATGTGSDAATTDKGGSGTSIKTPTDKVVAADKIDRATNDEGESAGKDKITITGDGTDAKYDYAVVDKTTGEIVAPIQTGSGEDADGWQQGGSGNLTFDGLDPNKEYEVVMRPHTDEHTPVGVPNTSGVTVGKVGAVDVTGIVKDKDGKPVKGAQVTVVVATTDGGTKKLTATTGEDGKYQITADAGVKLPGDYTLVVESDKGDAASPVTLSKVQPQPSTDVTVDPAVESLVTGLVTDPATGGPMKDAAITVIDKKTGEAVTLPAIKTDDAGVYVVDTSALPEGDYVVKATGKVGSTDVTGLTEVHVDGKGEATPIKPYKNTNVAPVPGGILSGVVKDHEGEGVAGAEVTVTVPIQNVKPDGTVETIGTKKVTVTTGEDGKYFVPGVPAGDYPVSVVGPDGNVKQDKVTVSGGSGADNADLTLPETKPTHANVVSGIVMDEDGKPVKNAAVTIYDKDGNKVATTPETVTTGEGGGWSVEGLDPAKGPYYASVVADGTNGVAGPFEVKADGTVKGGTNVELSGKVDTSSGTLTDHTEGKLLTGIVTDEANKPVSGATVVVTKDGEVIATATTDANGLYVVPNVPEGATVTVTTPGGSSGTGTLTESGGANKSDVTVTKPGADILVVIGPDGGKLAVKGSGSGKDAIVTIKDKDGNAVNEKFIIDGGVVKVNKTDPNKTPAGTYTVVLEQDGMKVEKTITVGSDGTIQRGAPITVDGHKDQPITGKLDYGSGAIPGDAAIAVTGPNGTVWGEAAVNPNDGTYQVPGIPEGTYTATVTVKDPEAKLTSTVTVDASGKASYGPWTESGTSTGATITTGEDGKTLTVEPGTAVQGVIGQIDTANAESGTLEQVKTAMAGFDTLTTEQKKQVPGDKVKDLSDKLEALLGDRLTIDAKAEGVKNTTEAADQLSAQRGLLVQDVVDTAAKKTVDVNLSLVAEDVTDSAPAKDVRSAEAAAKGAEMGAYYDVTIEKTIKVTEDETLISTATEKVDQVPVPITITLGIPADIQGHDYYNVIRVHQGDAQRIPSIATKTQITFASDRYSTYAIVWSDTPIFPGDTKVGEENNGGNQGGGTGSSGGGSSSSAGSVSVGKTNGGSVSVSPKSPKEGDEVTITVKPNEGYTLDKLVIKDSRGNEIKYVDNGDGTYTFTQPKGKVTISAEFRKVSGDPHDNGVDRLLTVDDHIAFMQGDEQGNFKPEYSITRAEAAQMFYNLLKDKDVKSTKTFADVAADAWYAKAVTALAELGILNGVGEGKFEPTRSITRAEFAAIAARFAVRTTGAVTFTDVEEDSWAYDVIGQAAYYGWINGYTDGSFKPGANITRAEAAKVVNTMLGRSADQSYVDKNSDSLKLFPDVPKNNWAFYEIVEAANAHDFTAKDGVESWGK